MKPADLDGTAKSAPDIPIVVAGEAAMLNFGAQLGALLMPGDVVYLHGELGTGKTTLVKGMLKGQGYAGAVTSPTYTLVEPYRLWAVEIYHFDLYRLESSVELETIGLRDMLTPESICLFEWPEKGQGVLPPPSKSARLRHLCRAREIDLHPKHWRTGVGGKV